MLLTEDAKLFNSQNVELSPTLWELSQGQECQVTRFKEGLEEHYCVRLMELGFHPGEQVGCVLATKLGAPRLYRVHNTIYSLDDDIAKLIEIQVID